MSISSMNNHEKTLLLFFECAAVDYGGLLQGLRMNTEDHETARRWNDSGFIQYGKIHSNDIKPLASTSVGKYPLYTLGNSFR